SRGGETIDLAGLGFVVRDSGMLGSGNVLSVTQGGTTDTLQLNPAVNYTGDVFVAASDGAGGTQVTLGTPCYVAGTRIATPGGEVRVEALRAGDAVLADTGAGWQVRTVRWVGRVMVDLVRHPCPERAAPVRIRAHAIGPGRPLRDLLVSPDHAIFLDGVLIQAQALRNGATVVQDFPARVTYCHIELDHHALLCAEGLPAESYLDTGNRALFAGAAGVRPLHADLAGAAAWDERAVAPLLLGGARVAAAQAGVRARAETLGWRLCGDPGLRVLADGVVLALDAHGRAALPPGAGTIRLASRRFVPRWLGLADDRRRLGVAVATLRLDGRALAPAAFGRGWHAAEAGWRWTDGDAHLALPAAAPRTLTLRLADAGARYWQPPQPLPPPKALKVMSV
ncbi:MAG: Hint domain-containing protein, partial [Rhodospirillales bacterium]|nr:Hint domain-containing protein [Rhodospirillales bacterium]